MNKGEQIIKIAILSNKLVNEIEKLKGYKLKKEISENYADLYNLLNKNVKIVDNGLKMINE